MQKKMPTLVGLILLVALISAVIFFFENITRGNSSAAGSIEPKNVLLTNISDTTTTVTWTTASPATGLISLSSPDGKKTTYFDERDSSRQNLNAYTGHSIPLQDLLPNTAYTYKIISNGKTFTENGNEYSAHTGTTIRESPGGLEPAYGIATDNGLPVTGALVYLTLEGGQTLSALTGKTGNWLIPLNLVRNTGLNSYLAGAKRLTENVKIIYNGNSSSAITDTLNDSPVPNMEMGKIYDFRRQQANKEDNKEIAQKEAPQVLGYQTTAATNPVFKVSLDQPAQDASLPTNVPLIAGTGIPGKSIDLVIGITNPSVGVTIVSSDGTWQYTPAHTLDEGLQSVTITTTDESNKPVAITHTFAILKSGTQVLGDATPSATLIPTPTLTPALTATPSPTSTLAGQPVPTSGSVLPTILLIIFGLAFMGSGAVLIVK